MLHPMATSPKKPATYQDIVDLPEHKVGEIVDGELYVSSRPALRQAAMSSLLGMVLGTPMQLGRDGPGGWWILDEPELHFGQNVLVPNLAGWRRERLPHLPDAPYFEFAPDWVCEVLSPSTAKLDVALKLPKYALAGVKQAWMVDPMNRLLKVFRQKHEQWVLVSAFGADDKVRAEPFEAVELELAELWLDEPAPSEP
jgi:Uma2 family endonuclease